MDIPWNAGLLEVTFQYPSLQLPYCWRGVALGRKYHHLRTSQLDQQNGISDGWPGGNFSNSSKTGPPDFSDKFLGMRQQHQIISRNNHDEHGTIGEHINTQWGLILFWVTFEFGNGVPEENWVLGTILRHFSIVCFEYSISTNRFRRNYYFLTFGLMYIKVRTLFKGGNYSRAETICGIQYTA